MDEDANDGTPPFFVCETKTLTKGGYSQIKTEGFRKGARKGRSGSFSKPLSLQETGTPCSYLSSFLKGEVSNI